MYLRMHGVFKNKRNKSFRFKQDEYIDIKILTDQESSKILNYLDREQLFAFYDTYLGRYIESNNKIQETDEAVIQRVLSCNTEAKSVLFVGFSQSRPTEGSEIRHNTQGYEKSLFTSAAEEHPGRDYNALKCDFRQYANLLEKFPQLNNFFDYIIVGSETIDYVPAEIWGIFGKLLKNSGLLLFSDVLMEEAKTKLQDFVKENDAFSNSILREMFLNPQDYHNMRGNYIANTICHFIAQGAGDIALYKCHIEKNEDLDNLDRHQELAQKIKLGLELSRFDSELSCGFGTRPIELVVVEKENQ